MSLQHEAPDETPERHGDLGDIRLLASEVRHLAQELARDRAERNRERAEDRAAHKDWRDKSDARVKAMEDLILLPPGGLIHRLAAVEMAVPDDLANQVAAATAARHNQRWRDRTVGAGVILLALKAGWDLVVKVMQG